MKQQRKLCTLKFKELSNKIMANTGHRGWYSANTMLKLYVLGIKGDEKKNK